jgi:hypothetical protein
VSNAAISLSSATMRCLSVRRISLAACSGSQGRLWSGRSRKWAVVWPRSVCRVSASRNSEGAVAISSPSWISATERALAALARTSRSCRIDSTMPVLPFGIVGMVLGAALSMEGGWRPAAAWTAPCGCGRPGAALMGARCGRIGATGSSAGSASNIECHARASQKRTPGTSRVARGRRWTCVRLVLLADLHGGEGSQRSGSTRPEPSSLGSTSAIMRLVAENGGEAELDFAGAVRGTVAEKSGRSIVPGGVPAADLGRRQRSWSDTTDARSS